MTRLVSDLKAGLEALYGPRLRGLYLFGSQVRGDSDAESDVDVLVVLDDFASYTDEVVRCSVLGAELSLKYEISLSKVFLRESDWAVRSTPFLRNMREEAVRV